MNKWIWKTYNQLTKDELYKIMRVRQEVFIIEQDCNYLDADGKDIESFHLYNENSNGKIQAYLRAPKPGVSYSEVSIGRVLITKEARGTGLGKELMLKGILKIQEELGSVRIRISAQKYLQKFYEDLGFIVCSDEYLEDEIPHIEMLKN